MRCLALFFAVGILSGCGPDDTTGRPPPTAPPKAPSGTAPPRAWVETSRGRVWLGYSTYCWNSRNGDKTLGTCADYVAPSCSGPNAPPKVLVSRGEVVTFHLGFEVEEPVSLTVFRDPPSGSFLATEELARSREPTWTVSHGGPISIFARAEDNGDASYVACLELRV